MNIKNDFKKYLINKFQFTSMRSNTKLSNYKSNTLLTLSLKIIRN